MNPSLEASLNQLTTAQLQATALDLGCVPSKSKPRSHTIQLILKQAALLGPENLNLQELGQAEKTDIRCICRRGKVDQLLMCSKCRDRQHFGCMKGIAALKPYECPKCQMEQMDPFAPITQFLTLPALVGVHNSHRSHVSFRLPAEHIGDSAYIRIQIRCLRLDSRGYHHSWPTEAGILLNSRPEVSISSSHGKKRRDHPMDLTLDMNKEMHTVVVMKKRDEQEYVYAVVVVGRRDVLDLICWTLAGKVMSFQEGKERVAAVFAEEGELSTECWRLSLCCPLTHILLETPVRGWKCKHLQCFDLRVFLTLQSDATANKWLCPLCKENCCNLIVDQYLEALAKEAARLENCSTVEFRSDGCYRLIQEEGYTGTTSLQAMTAQSEGYSPALLLNSSALSMSDGGIPTPVESFAWPQFLAGKVPMDQIYTSEVYRRAGKVEALKLYQRLTQPQERRSTRVSLGSVSTTHRASLGSVLKPICLD